MIKTTIEKIGPAPRIAVEHAGKGELVIFLHGIGGNRRNWVINCGLRTAFPCGGLGRAGLWRQR